MIWLHGTDIDVNGKFDFNVVFDAQICEAIIFALFIKCSQESQNYGSWMNFNVKCCTNHINCMESALMNNLEILGY